MTRRRLALATLMLLSAFPMPVLAMPDPVSGRWTIGIGDPTPLGWLTVVAYLVTAASTVHNVRVAARIRQSTRFWWLVALLMVALALNKQLDLQTWFLQTGKDLAIAQGWYDQRRVVQLVFMAVLIAGALGVVVLLRRGVGARWREYRWTSVGIVAIMAFIVVRATSFNHLDDFLGFAKGGVRVGTALELGGVMLVFAGSRRWLQLQREQPRAGHPDGEPEPPREPELPQVEAEAERPEP